MIASNTTYKTSKRETSNGCNQGQSKLSHCCSSGGNCGGRPRTQTAEVQAIGAGAVNQAVKALVLAKGYLAEDGISVVAIPEFVDVDIEGKVRTAIKLTVEPR